MDNYWFKNAIIYSVSVESFYDANGDGIGDLPGLTDKLDYLSSLGVTCLWLLPITPSPMRDSGYDVCDYYGIHERFGDPGDFVVFMEAAHSRGLRVIVDLALQHTSDEHPWFQQARADERSPFRDYYLWFQELPPPEKRPPQIVHDAASPQQPYTYDEEAGAYYQHHFYSFEPDLNSANAEVRRQFRKIMAYWLELGVDGFRIDAAPYLAKAAAPAYGGDTHGLLREFRDTVEAQQPGSILMAETDVPPDQLDEYFGGGEEMHMLLNFVFANYLFLALVREDAGPLRQALDLLPGTPRTGKWANFLRNHDELDLERLSEEERQEVFRALAPDENMRIYGRGIRRRLAPMLGGEESRLRLAFSLLFSLPGAPVLLYGDEIGMGDDLSLDERYSVRTPMQWTGEENAGFSQAPAGELVRPVVEDGDYGYRGVNVAAQRRDPDSLLNWMSRLIRTRRQTPEVGTETARVIETDQPAVLALRYSGAADVLIIVNNLSGEDLEVDLGGCDDLAFTYELFPDRDYGELEAEKTTLAVGGYGYRWIRGRLR